MQRREFISIAAGLVLAATGLAADQKANDPLVGKWALTGSDVKQTVEFARDGTLKMTTSHILVNGKLTPVTKDGKTVDLALEGKYKLTGDNAIETELKSPFPDIDKNPLVGRWKDVKVTKDTLTFIEGEGQNRKYERVK